MLKVLKPIWTTKPETASRLRGRIEKVLGWASAMKYRGGENPAAWTGPLQHLLPATSSVRVPLTDEAASILQFLSRDERYVFHNESGRKLSNMAMLQLLRGIRDDGFTVHGFRSSFRDWAAEQTNTPREMVEACLAHAVGDAAELAYKRSDFLEKRRAVMGLGEVDGLAGCPLRADCVDLVGG